MLQISKITVTSSKNTGLQVLKDNLTATEKRILIYMLNNDILEGQVKNKVFNIKITGNNTANVVIGTITKSIILGRDEIVKNRVSIKFS
jgi:hypothetical protein